jgi:hypothetical protein
VTGDAVPIAAPFTKKSPDGTISLLAEIVCEPVVMDVQAFLMARGSGMAKMSWKEGLFKTWTAAEWIRYVAERYSIRPQFILTVLQAEQSLVGDSKTYAATFQIVPLKDKTLTAPPVEAGWIPRRNGGYWDDKNRGVAGWIPRTTDGNWWVAVKGDFKAWAATGAGIIGPNDWPTWDVRNYIGFPKQVEQVGILNRKYGLQYDAAISTGRVIDRTIILQDKTKVIAGSRDTYRLLKWTNNAGILAVRPRINKDFSA